MTGPAIDSPEVTGVELHRGTHRLAWHFSDDEGSSTTVGVTA